MVVLRVRPEREKKENPIPLAQYLKNYLAPAWGPGKIKTVLTLRNQPEWLASFYSQKSEEIKDAGQNDFEQRVRELTAFNDSFLDWESMIKDLAWAIGEENVCVLLCEDMDRPNFWEELTSFMEIERMRSPFASCNVRFNTRRSSQHPQWRIRPPRYPLGLLQKYIQKKWPSNTLTFTRKCILKGLEWKSFKKVETILYSFIFNRNRGQHIYLNERTKKRIREHVKPFNKRLSRRLNRNLTHLGY